MDVSFDFDYLCVSTHLRLSKKEKRKLLPQLKKIVEWIIELEKPGQIKEDIFFHDSLSLSCPLRKDKAVESFSNKRAFLNSPETQKNYFCVPKVIKSKSK